jgi:hypothetical protein
MKKSIFSIFLACGLAITIQASQAQRDTTIVQTFTFDSTARAGYFQFPTADPNSYEKVLMQYRMRCKKGLISNSSDRNKGCGEWDYSCNTYITDSSRIDSFKQSVHKYQSSFSNDGSNISYSNQIAYNIFDRKKLATTFSNTVGETIVNNFTAKSGTSTKHFSGFNQNGKGYYLYDATTLSNLGLTAGAIDAIAFQNGLSDTLIGKNLKISVDGLDIY